MATKKKIEKWYWNWLSKHIYMAAAAVCIVVFFLFSMLDVITRHNKELEVPSFAGMDLAQARKIADELQLRLEVTDSVYIVRMSPGAIYKQNPLEGSKVKRNRRILLTINANSPKMVSMPSLVGFSLRQAQSELSSSQLKVGKLIYVRDIATNNVLAQLYEGKPIEPGTQLQSESVIDLRLGLNEADSVALVPSVIGKPYPIVKDFLIDNSLNMGKVYFDSTVSTLQDSLSAFAYRQETAMGKGNHTARYGAAVSVYFTLDKSLIPVTESDGAEEEER
ncbi:MAG: PASTA domain-containing protein [Bacteroidales bacterium]|nr:PASTA domain-containing protein [Bacteroidales bacterium]